MTGLRKAPRQTPAPKPEPETRSYRVLSKRCIWGRKGEIIELALGQKERTLLMSGVLEVVEPVELEDRPLKSAEEEG